MITNVIQYLQMSANRFPNKKAFCDSELSLTYSELDAMAKKIATRILKKTPTKDVMPIVVYLPKGVKCIAAFMGIVYSGNYYVPIDIKLPQERVNSIISVLNPKCIITGTEDIEIEGITDRGIEIIGLDECNAMMPDCERLKEVEHGHVDINPLYVLFTSGSTGIPKGVIITHRAVIDYIEWLSQFFEFDETVIFGNQAPFYFDNSILDIYSTLKHGSTMDIIPEHKFMFPNQLIEYLNEKKINTIFWVPSALVAIANSGILETKQPRYLKRILFCGEVMPNKQLNIWRKHLTDILYANLYGPTEITDVCTCYVVDREFDDDESLPIGYPCKNTQIMVLNEKDEICTSDEIGELCVRGSGVSLGYFGDVDRTNQVFVQNPLNSKWHDIIYRTGDLVKYNERGELVYICRKDLQIKHMGHRIELGEIESAAYAYPGIKQCCALYDNINKKIHLICAMQSSGEEKAIYKILQTKIPRYMLPTAITIKNELKLNANGKIDRKNLMEEILR